MADVETLRVEGNEAFKRGDFAGAVAKYTEAIAKAPTNHLLYSNRSLAHHSAEDFVSAEADARKCLELAPDFVKGVYRLANALVGLKHYDAADATIKEGLLKDPDNPELKKIARVIKGRRDRDKRKERAKAAPRSAEVDEQTKRDAQQLSESLQNHGRELQETKARLGAIRREIARTNLTRQEIGALAPDATVYRSVGKMFLESDKPGVEALLQTQLDRGAERNSQLSARAQFLDRRIKEQTAEFQ
eukprot:CAMPEP_0119273630 /NCGR_PEP_ID=MMETSP1329-20130426/10801_1 /TAXON_ID=114041 /ORGANISM="Genus nov. species nov., Strain RCC1024" /LENGTH=245 /DNA_ID=CAMNT_0007273859 /DNA_START=146 /DNA_END=880 /DNA_ORIENTATION=-